MEGAKGVEAYLQNLPSATKRAATEQGGEGGTAGRAFLATVGAALALAWTCRVVLQRQQRRQTGADKGGAAAGRGAKRGGAPPTAGVEPLERLAPNVKGDGFELSHRGGRHRSLEEGPIQELQPAPQHRAPPRPAPAPPPREEAPVPQPPQAAGMSRRAVRDEHRGQEAAAPLVACQGAGDYERAVAEWVRAGDRVLEVGCQMRQQTRALAAAVAPGGAVVGVDVHRNAEASTPAGKGDGFRRPGEAIPGVRFEEVASPDGALWELAGPAARGLPLPPTRSHRLTVARASAPAGPRASTWSSSSSRRPRGTTCCSTPSPTSASCLRSAAPSADRRPAPSSCARGPSRRTRPAASRPRRCWPTRAGGRSSARRCWAGGRRAGRCSQGSQGRIVAPELEAPIP
jgi:hypothetical protein